MNKTIADYVIAVIGKKGVGKSVIIRKAFKSWGLSEATAIGEEDNKRRGKQKRGYRCDERSPTSNTSCLVLSYTTQVETGQPPKMRIVQLLEVDIASLQVPNLDGMPSGINAWPRFLPRVDGVMVCYSALDGGSTDLLPAVICMSTA